MNEELLNEYELSVWREIVRRIWDGYRGYEIWDLVDTKGLSHRTASLLHRGAVTLIENLDWSFWNRDVF